MPLEMPTGSVRVDFAGYGESLPPSGKFKNYKLEVEVDRAMADHVLNGGFKGVDVHDQGAVYHAEFGGSYVNAQHRTIDVFTANVTQQTNGGQLEPGAVRIFNQLNAAAEMTARNAPILLSDLGSAY